VRAGELTLDVGPDLEALGHRLGHRFRDPSLLRQALSHRSWCAEYPGHPSNERLEYLGDAVLGWVVADLAFQAHDDLSEGKLTDLRKAVVNAAALAQVADEIELGDDILLGKGEAAAGGRRKPSILSDALEAVIGAVYLDGGPEAARVLVARLLASRLDEAVNRLAVLDHKTALQEQAARLFELTPVYSVREEGPDHEKRFFATVRIGPAQWGEGEGRSKKQAEQAAARQACVRLQSEDPSGHA
jgi:ribonuclease III